MTNVLHFQLQEESKQALACLPGFCSGWGFMGLVKELRIPTSPTPVANNSQKFTVKCWGLNKGVKKIQVSNQGIIGKNQRRHDRGKMVWTWDLSKRLGRYWVEIWGELSWAPGQNINGLGSFYLISRWSLLMQLKGGSRPWIVGIIFTNLGGR